MLDFDFWKGKKVFLTGHTGFKGTWMRVFLHLLGCVCEGYSLPDDIRHADKVERAIEAFKPDVIIHLAAFGFVAEAAANPLETFSTNVTGLSNVLEAARKQPVVKSVIVVTSDKCYKDGGGGRECDETFELGSGDPYSASKACQELVAQSYAQTYGLPVATARASNVLGGGDGNKARLVPYLMECFASGVTAKIRKMEAVRSWQNVLDVLYGYLLLAQRLYAGPEYAGAYNFGPGADGFQTVGAIAETLAGLYDNAAFEAAGELGVHESDALRLDSSKAERMLGYRSVYGVRETLEQTVKVDIELKRGNYAVYADYVKECLFGGRHGHH